MNINCFDFSYINKKNKLYHLNELLKCLECHDADVVRQPEDLDGPVVGAERHDVLLRGVERQAAPRRGLKLKLLSLWSLCLHCAVMVKKATPRLRDPAGPEESSRNLGPIFSPTFLFNALVSSMTSSTLLGLLPFWPWCISITLSPQE